MARNKIEDLRNLLFEQIEKLMDKDFDSWSNEIQRMIPFYGQTMTKSATIAFENGLIEKRHYLSLTGGGGAGQPVRCAQWPAGLEHQRGNRQPGQPQRTRRGLAQGRAKSAERLSAELSAILIPGSGRTLENNHVSSYRNARFFSAAGRLPEQSGQPRF